MDGEGGKVDDGMILVGGNESYEGRCGADDMVGGSRSEEEEM